MSPHASTETIEEIQSTFSLLEDWEDRYRYLVELGRGLAPLPDDWRNAQTKVPGCASQVWLHTQQKGRKLYFLADSDAHIVKGLIAVLLALYSGRTAEDILALNPRAVFEQFGFDHHLTPQRSNGLSSIVDRIRREAQARLEP